MTDREVNIALREMAKNIGACRKEVDPWTENDTIDMCLERYIRTLDFAVEKDFPPLDFVRKHLRTEDLHMYHIYLDDEVIIENAESGIWIFLGNCDAGITFSDFSVGTVYVRHKSTVNVGSKDFAKVFVSVFDEGLAELRRDGSASAFVYDKRK